jgi:hypothetical protein
VCPPEGVYCPGYQGEKNRIDSLTILKHELVWRLGSEDNSGSVSVVTWGAGTAGPLDPLGTHLPAWRRVGRVARLWCMVVGPMERPVRS